MSEASYLLEYFGYLTLRINHLFFLDLELTSHILLNLSQFVLKLGVAICLFVDHGEVFGLLLLYEILKLNYFCICLVHEVSNVLVFLVVAH
jgi:hypothetical protein